MINTVLAAAVGALVVFCVFVCWRYFWILRQRRRAIQAWAESQGLAVVPTDPFDYTSFDLSRFSIASGWYEVVVGGEWRGLTLHLGLRHTKEASLRFALVDLGRADLPRVVVQPEGWDEALVGMVGLRDIEFEHEEFNRRFHVRAEDREFAYKLLDARMMQYLLSTPGGMCVEVVGGSALLWEPWRDARLRDAFLKRHSGSDGLTALLYRAKGFADKVPRLVRNEYGKAAT